MISQRQFLIRLSISGVPRLHRLNGECPEFSGHLFGGRQRLLGVGLDRELQELLEVCDEKTSEVMRPAEDLTEHLEGREPDLRMLLVQLGHNQVVEMINVVIGNSVVRKRRGI